MAQIAHALDLEAGTIKLAAGNFLQRQTRFDDFVDCYNNERTLQALDMKTMAYAGKRNLKTPRNFGARSFQRLYYAVAAADHGSFRSAAETLMTQQTTLSRCVRLLEHTIGTSDSIDIAVVRGRHCSASTVRGHEKRHMSSGSSRSGLLLATACGKIAIGYGSC